MCDQTRRLAQEFRRYQKHRQSMAHNLNQQDTTRAMTPKQNKGIPRACVGCWMSWCFGMNDQALTELANRGITRQLDYMLGIIHHTAFVYVWAVVDIPPCAVVA
eukprot:m.324970 g.324970  ORF g.324970 m.324970 type:complete len:104 (+) comp16014_c0_seq10:4497-4808(+)